MEKKEKRTSMNQGSGPERLKNDIRISSYFNKEQTEMIDNYGYSAGIETRSRIVKSLVLRGLLNNPSAVILAMIALISIHTSIFAQANGTVSSTVITEGLSDHFSTVWGVVLWVSRAILMVVAAFVAVKNVMSGHSQDRAGGWITVIGVILVAIGIGFVPSIANTLFGISF